MKLLLLVASLLAQDTTDPAVSPRARAILDRIPPPTEYGVSMVTRFSRDTVWSGEQVDMVTAAWFPRDLRQRLRRSPMLRAPALSGLWSATGQTAPVLAETRRVGPVVYDLFATHQILFPLSPGEAVAPPAVLSYGLPAGSSFFSPEERFTVQSAPVALTVRPIPGRLRAALGGGPTAAELRVGWRLAAHSVGVGAPLAVELVISGKGNVALWPIPEIEWPDGVRVYTEPAAEHVGLSAGAVQGEKRFRFTVVPESAGSFTLPVIRYPYFDPSAVTVRTASAAPVVVWARRGNDLPARITFPVVSTVTESPVEVLAVRFRPLLVLLALTPLLPLLLRRRRRSPPMVREPDPTVDELRRLLAANGRGTVPAAVVMRQRGVSEGDAAAVAAWLEAEDRGKWGGLEAPADPPAALGRVMAALRSTGGAIPALLLAALLLAPAALGAQTDSAVARYAGGDVGGAIRLFEQVVADRPLAPDAWANLAAARWAGSDDVGAAAAWLSALRLAPRDGRIRDAWSRASTIPPDVRAMAPRLPVSSSELVLISIAAWLAAGFFWWRGRRRPALVAVGIVVVGGMIALGRSVDRGSPTALVRPDAELRVSPLLQATSTGSIPAWSVVTISGTTGDWRLVELGDGRRGWIAAGLLAELGP